MTKLLSDQTPEKAVYLQQKMGLKDLSTFCQKSAPWLRNTYNSNKYFHALINFQIHKAHLTINTIKKLCDSFF